MTALQWSWERSFHESQRERASLHDRVLVSEQAMADAWAGAATTERERAELQAELDAIHASRAWRLVSRYARWRNRLLPPRG